MIPINVTKVIPTEIFENTYWLPDPSSVMNSIATENMHKFKTKVDSKTSL